MKTRVVVVDDHKSIRQMLGRILALDGKYEVVGDTGSGLEGLQMCRDLRPRVAIVDLLLPGMSGVELLQALRKDEVDTRVLIYSGTLNQTLVATAIATRPHGFVHKEDSLPALMEGLKVVASGGKHITPFALALAEQGEMGGSAASRLSSRERTVLQLVAEGCSSKTIGDRLGISVKTVEHHRTTLMGKLDVHDVAGLTRLAVREGLVRND